MKRPGSVVPSSLNDLVSIVHRIGQAHSRFDVRGQVFPHLPEHLTAMNIGFGQLVAQDVERTGLDGIVHLHPVLVSLGGVRSLVPRPLPAAEASGIGGDDDLAFRQHVHDEVMEPLPYPQSTMAAVVPA